MGGFLLHFDGGSSAEHSAAETERAGCAKLADGADTFDIARDFEHDHLSMGQFQKRQVQKQMGETYTFYNPYHAFFMYLSYPAGWE